MKAAIAIPRFLLPQGSSIWRSQAMQSSRFVQAIRNASHRAPSKPKQAQAKPIVLEKPARFNPPSHGARLRKDVPRHYGAPLSDVQREAQKRKRYPNMMPSEGTFLYWFLNNRSIHLYITLGTLFSLAGYTSVTHFKRTSKFADMLPPASDLFFHPISFLQTCFEVFKLHTNYVSAEAAESRRKKLDDVDKRKAYRKAHGIKDEGLVAWIGQADEEEGNAVVSIGVDEGSPVNPIVEAVGRDERQEEARLQKRPLKKWLGIW